MNLPDGYHLTYQISHESWNWPQLIEDNEEEIVVAATRDNGQGVKWEFSFVANRGGRDPYLRIYNDAWDVFHDLSGLFRNLAAGPPQTLTQVQNLLQAFGGKDITEREKPVAQMSQETRDAAKRLAVMARVNLDALRQLDPTLAAQFLAEYPSR